VVRADNLANFKCRLSRNSMSLNLMEPYGPVQTCNEIAETRLSSPVERFGLRDRRPTRVVVQFPARATDFTPFKIVQTGSELHQVSCSLGDEVLTPHRDNFICP